MLFLLSFTLVADAQGRGRPRFEALRINRAAANLAEPITAVFDTLERTLDIIQFLPQVAADGKITLAQKKLGGVFSRMVFNAVTFVLVDVRALLLEIVKLGLKIGAHAFKLGAESVQVVR
jgi:hypothetical protein